MGMAAVMVEDPNGAWFSLSIIYTPLYTPSDNVLGLRRGEVQPNAAWDQLCSIYDALPPDLQ